MEKLASQTETETNIIIIIIITQLLTRHMSVIKTNRRRGKTATWLRFEWQSIKVSFEVTFKSR